MFEKKLSTKWIIAGIAIALLLGIVIFGVFFNQQENETGVYVAVAGPMTKPNGQTMVNAAKLYFDQHKIPGKRIEIIACDDNNEAALAEQCANQIAKDNKAVMVLGHRVSNASLKAGIIYEQNKIPALTGSSSTPAGNEWFFSVIFDNVAQGRFLAGYVTQVLGQERVSIIYDTDSYGKPFAEALIEQARSKGTEIAFERSFTITDAEKNDPALYASLMDDIILKLREVKDPGLVIYIVHDQEGAELVKRLRDRDKNISILEALITKTFYDHLDKITGNQKSQYLHNVWTTQTLMYDVGNELAQEFIGDYKKAYGAEPDASAAAYYDAAMLAFKAIQATNAGGADIQKDRQAIRDYLGSLNHYDPKMRGTTGYIYFDKEGVAIKAVPIGIYDNGTLISAPHQLRVIPNKDLIRDFNALVESKDIVFVDGRYMYKTKVVYTGIDLNKISNIDMKNYTFFADFYLWFRYQGEFNEKEIEFINAKSPISLGNPIAEDTYNGITYRAYRVRADFKVPFDYRNYPFDKQTLEIVFRHPSQTKEQLIYVRDNLRLMPKAELMKQLSQSGIDGWNPIDIQVYADTLASNSTLGNPRITEAVVEYSTFKADLDLQRDALNFSIKNLFPLFAVVLLSYLAFFMPPDQFSVRVSLGINGIMTTAFFSLKVANDLPPLGYLVALEYIFFMIYILAIFVITHSIIGNVFLKGDPLRFRRFDIFGRIVHPTIILAAALYLINILR